MAELDREQQPHAGDDSRHTAGDRALIDIGRARKALGPEFARKDPRAMFYLKRAKLNALLEIGRAIRGEHDQSG